MVIIEGLSANGYYIKLSACTAAGQGPSTEKQSVKLAPVDNLGMYIVTCKVKEVYYAILCNKC